MTPLRRNLLICAVCVAAASLFAWWWFNTMEKRWIAVSHYSDAMRENPMLAATRLLKRHGHVVDIEATLGEALLRPIPDGTIVLDDNNGIITRNQTEQLLNWVRKGNTLIARPKWSNRFSYLSCDGQDLSDKTAKKPVSRNVSEADPLGNRFGVELVWVRRYKEKEDKKKSAPVACVAPPPPCMAHFTPPGKSYPLDLDVDDVALDGKNQAAASASTPTDEGAAGVRIYDEGKGHVVFVASDYFDNNSVGLDDNAELLLDLASLNRDAKHVLLVKRLDVLAWWQALWSHFRYGIVSLGAGLMLLLWIAIRRFGPLVPEPDTERRSLMEHIDASGRWLWQAAGGRASLLDAARNAVNNTLHRRIPDLRRMRPQEQLDRLAKDTGISQDALDAALSQPASQISADFTRQIQILQQLGKHYER